MLISVTPWEFGCCGEPFALGDEVLWNVSPVVDRAELVPSLGTELAQAVDFFETHHELDVDTQRQVTGTVSRIRVVIVESASTHENPVQFRAVPGTLELRDLDRLDREIAAGISEEFEMTLSDGSPLPPPRIEEFAPIEGEGSAGSAGSSVPAVNRSAHPARRVRRIDCYLVDLDLDLDLDLADSDH